ncbi:MAG TPA: HAD family hydrolase [Spirochaetia bacterium]|nr:HAD family hydrolase [Spirochaetia bacterium]
MAGIDFFDVDHTITRRSSGARFVSLAIRRGILPRRVLLVLPWYSFTYRLGLLRLKDYKDGFPYLRGIPRSVLKQIARESFETRLRGDIYPEAVQVIAERRKLGRRVTLASSSLDFIIDPLAGFLGIDTVLATSLEFLGEECTGRVAGIPMLGREKRERVLQFISESGEDPRECAFYSDSIFDVPLLESVGHPVAVNPDIRLRRIARSRGWRILSFA